MSVCFPGTGTGAARTTNVARIGRAIVFCPKVVARWWFPATTQQPNRERKH